MDFNSDRRSNELDNEIEKIDLKNTSKNTSTQKAAKKIVKKYRNSKRKAQLVKYSKLKKCKDDDVVFIKQVPVHPRDRFKKLAAAAEKVEFIKQVLVYPKDRLKRARKEKDEHPRGRMKNKEEQIARDKVSKLMCGEFNFDPKKY